MTMTTHFVILGDPRKWVWRLVGERRKEAAELWLYLLSRISFEQLVLAEDKKELIRAVARNAVGTKWDDDSVAIRGR
jgi:hypothetical protein